MLQRLHQQAERAHGALGVARLLRHRAEPRPHRLDGGELGQYRALQPVDGGRLGRCSRRGLGLLPPPLWGRVGEGGNGGVRGPPPPCPSPTRGEGTLWHRPFKCWRCIRERRRCAKRTLAGPLLQRPRLFAQPQRRRDAARRRKIAPHPAAALRHPVHTGGMDAEIGADGDDRLGRVLVAMPDDLNQLGRVGAVRRHRAGRASALCGGTGHALSRAHAVAWRHDQCSDDREKLGKARPRRRAQMPQAHDAEITENYRGSVTLVKD